jgi:ribosomal protein L5
LTNINSSSIITTMKPLVTTKLTPEALRLVRVIAALTGEKQYEVLERILKVELERVRQNEGSKDIQV